MDIQRGSNTRPGNHNKGKLYTIAGLSISIAERICKFVFQDFFISIVKDTKERKFVLRLSIEIEGEGKDSYKLDEELVEEFTDYWGKSFWTVQKVKEQILS